MNNTTAAIIIQKYYKRFIIKSKLLIPPSYIQTKTWRNNQYWYKNGKSNECEKYQIKIIEDILKIKVEKTSERININTYELAYNKNPLIKSDGYDWSENFDGKIIKSNITYYFNLKFVCDNGGAQTRTLREVYHLIKYNNTTIKFINILNGDTCYKNMNKFNYLLNKNKEYNKYIFIGSLYDFQNNSKFSSICLTII